MVTVKKQTQAGKRPPLLSALCILTFIGSTVGFFGYFLASVFFDKATEIIIKYSSWHSAEVVSPVYFTFLMVFYALSLTGAIRMWKLHRDGFFLYATVQVTALMLPALWINVHSFSFTNLIFVAVFILGYALNLKWMK